MTPTRQKAIRHVLRQHAEGLTAKQLEALLGINASDVRRCLKVMPDVYTDRWVKGGRGQFERVWVAVHVPPHCPHPKDRPFKYAAPRTVWQHPVTTQ